MKITLSNVSGDLKSEIGSLVRFYSVNLKRPYSQFLGKGVFGTKLASLLKESHSIAPENLIEEKNLGIQKKDGGGPDVPPTYEAWLESERVNRSFFEKRIDGRAICGIYKV